MSYKILIYANCIDFIAKGDFTFAGHIAKDLMRTIHGSDLDLDVILTSTHDGLPRFKALYGEPVDGRVLIDEISVGLSALETFDAITNQVVLFIEANPCKSPEADLLKRVLSPQTKFLFMGGYCRPAYSRKDQPAKLWNLLEHQKDIYEFFNPKDILFTSSGIGHNRIGLPEIKSINEFKALNVAQQQQLPKIDYGFIYVASAKPLRDLEAVVQYLLITQLNQYVLIGAFATIAQKVHEKITAALSQRAASSVSITYLPAVEHQLMRFMAFHAKGILHMSTGVMSTLELMNDGKLSYYQALSSNKEFVKSYLSHLKSSIFMDRFLSFEMRQSLLKLSDLLFEQKPLRASKETMFKVLIANPEVTSHMVRTNQKILNKARGTLANNMFSFLQTTSHVNLKKQYRRVCCSLRQEDEAQVPVCDTALRRAAALGLLFELKVIINYMNAEDINRQDKDNGYTALHYAVLHEHQDCVEYLIQSGADQTIEDYENKTPLMMAKHLSLK